MAKSDVPSPLPPEGDYRERVARNKTCTKQGHSMHKMTLKDHATVRGQHRQGMPMLQRVCGPGNRAGPATKALERLFATFFRHSTTKASPAKVGRYSGLKEGPVSYTASSTFGGGAEWGPSNANASTFNSTHFKGCLLSAQCAEGSDGG